MRSFGHCHRSSSIVPVELGCGRSRGDISMAMSACPCAHVACGLWKTDEASARRGISKPFSTLWCATRFNCGFAGVEHADDARRKRKSQILRRFGEVRAPLQLQISSATCSRSLANLSPKCHLHTNTLCEYRLSDFYILLGSATASSFNMYGYPGTFAHSCIAETTNMRRCSGLQWTSRLCRSSAWHGPSWNGCVKWLNQFKLTLTKCRSSRRCSSPWCSTSARCRKRSDAPNSKRIPRPSIRLAATRKHAKLQLQRARHPPGNTRRSSWRGRQPSRRPQR